MSGAMVLINQLQNQDINLAVDGDALTVDAPKGVLTPQLRKTLSRRKAEFIKTLRSVHGLSVAELRQAAGPDWQQIQDDPRLLDAFAHAVMVGRMRRRGEVPAHYTARTVCKGCGPVPIFEGVPDRIDGCPWCFNRVQGLPVPVISEANNND